MTFWSLEGYVVRDKEWNRIKIKSPQYVALSHLNLQDGTKLSARHMLQIIVSNEGSEFLSYFPEHRNLYELVKVQYDRLVDRLQKFLDSGSKNVPGKYKSVVAKLSKQSDPSISTVLQEMDIKELVKLVESESRNKEEEREAKLTQQYDDVPGIVQSKKKKKKKKLDRTDETDPFT